MALLDADGAPGALPPRVAGLVTEWATLHQSELMENWISLELSGTFRAIEPLCVELDTVVWANGFDLAPEFLYARVVGRQPTDVAS